MITTYYIKQIAKHNRYCNNQRQTNEHVTNSLAINVEEAIKLNYETFC